MRHLERFWGHRDLGTPGPTDAGFDEVYLVLESESSLSAGEGVLLRVVFDLWNGAGRVTLADMREHLDSGVCQAIGELLMAESQDDFKLIDEWEKTWTGFDPAKDFSSG